MARRRNRKSLTDAERDERRKADRERIERAARALLSSDGWERWIRVRANNGLSRYSIGNQMLIAIECHARGITPTYVAGWGEDGALDAIREYAKTIDATARRIEDALDPARCATRQRHLGHSTTGLRLARTAICGSVGGCVPR